MGRSSCALEAGWALKGRARGSEFGLFDPQTQAHCYMLLSSSLSHSPRGVKV